MKRVLFVLLLSLAAWGAPWTLDGETLFRQSNYPLAMFADSQKVAAGSPQGVEVVALATGKRSFSLEQGDISSLSLRPDGKQLALGQSHDRVTVWNLGDSSVAWTATTGRPDAEVRQTLMLVAWTRDGQQVMTVGSTWGGGSPDPWLRWWSGGKTARKLSARDACRSANGKLLFLRGPNELVQASGRKLKSFGADRGLGFSGDEVLTAGEEGLFWTSAQQQTPGPELDPEQILGIGPERSLVLAEPDASARLSLRRSNGVSRELVHHGQEKAYFCCFSPDGRYVVTQNAGPPTAYVWEVETGKLVSSFPFEGESCLFTPDGQWLVSNGPRGLYALHMTDLKLKKLR